VSIRPLALGAVIALVGCSRETASQETSITVTISPQSAALLVGANATFSALVSGGAGGGVTFTVVEGAAGGAIAADGRYVAPPKPGEFHVRATSTEDPARYAEATVAVAGYERRILRLPDASTARDHHAATLLRDGSVLVTGGIGYEPGALRAADRFDPGARVFRDGGALLVPRMAHAAVLLPKGEVLVTGGWDPAAPGTQFDPVLRSTELYDAAARRFTAGPDMLFPRRHHSMTLLADGRVFVAGGIQLRGLGFGATSNTEVYDPTAHAFVGGPRMVAATGRWLHTATLLADGRVLIAGGRDNNCTGLCTTPALATAEIYDPATNVLAPTGSLLASRYGHSATRLADGRVLVLGGETTEGGGPGGWPVPTAEVWDPATGEFAPAGSLAEGRAHHAIAELGDGTLLLAGGQRNSGNPSGGTEIFDPATGASTPGPEMNDWRIRATATRLATGEVLVVGGNNSGGAVLPVDLFF
jgi:galactose oxidase-like protein